MNPHTKAGIIPLEGPIGPIWFQWNPNKIGAIKTEAHYATIGVAGSDKPYQHYSHGETQVIQFELTLNRWRAPDGYIRNFREALAALARPIIPMSAINRPPKVKFVFGDEIRETCIVKSVSPVLEELFEPMSLLSRKASIQVTLWIYNS